MKKFIGFASNGKFSVGCTGQTVYLYDENGNEINKFKDIAYGYTPAISPNGKMFVVKSTDGRLAFYSLESFSLIKKFRFSKVDGAQDDGFCFSSDGHFFVNIERQKDDLHSAISIYNTSDFSSVNQINVDENMMINHIEFDETSDTYYVLGFIRNSDLVIKHGFVAKSDNFKIQNITPISDNEFEFYRSYMNLKIMGFTEKSYNFSNFKCNLNELKTMNHTLAKLYTHYN